MDSIVQSIRDAYIYCFYTAKDPRAHTWEWPLTQSPPYAFFTLLISYTLLVRYGPRVMKNRKPYNPQMFMIVYNVLQIILNTSTSIAAIYFCFIKKTFDFKCQLIDRTNDVEYALTYSYFALKVLDLLDTVFIVLRKHSNQLSFLHCYHHFLMVCSGYLGAMWTPGGAGILLGVVNSLVHSFMYSYYLATALKPELRSSIWFKRNITHIQLFQFMLLSICYSRTLFSPSCTYPRPLSVILFSQNIYMLYLFSNFYVKTYLKKKK